MSSNPVINPDEIGIETNDSDWPDVRMEFTVPAHCVKLIVDRLESEGQKIEGPKLYDLLAHICFEEAVSRLDLEPIWGPSIIPMQKPMVLREGEDFCFTGCLDARLDIEWPDFGELKIERPIFEIDDALIDAELEEQGLDIGESSPSNERLVRGDEATGSLWIGNAESDECFINSTGVTIRVPAGNRPTLVEGIPVPELTGKLLGAGPGDHLEVVTNAPTLEGMPEIAGTKLTCRFTIDSCRRIKPATIDEIVSYYECPNIQGLRLQVYHSLELRFEREQMIQLTEHVLGLLMDMLELPYPERVLLEEVMRQQRMQYEAMKDDGVVEEDIRSQLESSEGAVRKRTEQKIRRKILVSMLQKHFKVNVVEHQINEYIQLLASMRGESPDLVRKEIVDGNLTEQVALKCIEREIVLRILEAAQVIDTPADTLGFHGKQADA
ncbi:MAG: hypothetical protein CMJ36_00735 [Phycisphaerae bacterium]|nr:hypothetical protein [Phycisphaerae bacterium]